MGCVKSKIRTSEGIRCAIEDFAQQIRCRVQSARVDMTLQEFKEQIRCRVVSIPRMMVEVGIICTAEEAYYLNVSPQEVQWITEDEVIVYRVRSNVDWVIN